MKKTPSPCHQSIVPRFPFVPSAPGAAAAIPQTPRPSGWRPGLLGLVAAGLAAAIAPAARAQSPSTLTPYATFAGFGSYLPANAYGGLYANGNGILYGVSYAGGYYNGGCFYSYSPITGMDVRAFFPTTDPNDLNSGCAYGISLGSPVQGSSGAFYGTFDGQSALGDFIDGGHIYQLAAGRFSLVYAFSQAGGETPVTGLTLASDGNLYGTTSQGGTLADGTNGEGTVYQFVPSTGVVTTIYTFTGGSDGGSPGEGALVQASNGLLYGTTTMGGIDNNGVIYSIDPASGAFSVVHAFAGGDDGAYPNSGLVQGPQASLLYGVTDPGTDGNGIAVAATLYEIDIQNNYGTLNTIPGAVGGVSKLAVGSDNNLYGTCNQGGANGLGFAFQVSHNGNGDVVDVADFANNDGSSPNAAGMIVGPGGDLYGTTLSGPASGGFPGFGTIFELTAPPPFFADETALGSGVYYLTFPDGTPFGYYSFLSDPNYIYHYDLGYEYVFDAADGQGGVYLYDFASTDFFYTSPVFPFPYLYDFGLNSVLYYYPDTSNAGQYTTNPRYFYDYATSQIITK